MSIDFIPSEVDLDTAAPSMYWDEQNQANIEREKTEWTTRLSWFFQEEGLAMWLTCKAETQMKGALLLRDSPRAEARTWALRDAWMNYNPTNMLGMKTWDGYDKYSLRNLLTRQGMSWLISRGLSNRQMFLALFEDWEPPYPFCHDILD